jgi:hypothetical protein
MPPISTGDGISCTGRVLHEVNRIFTMILYSKGMLLHDTAVNTVDSKKYSIQGCIHRRLTVYPLRLANMIHLVYLQNAMYTLFIAIDLDGHPEYADTNNI